MHSTKRISLHHYRLASEVSMYIRLQVRENNVSSLSIEKLSQHFAVSETTLKQIFKQRYHIPIHTYVLKERISYICELLEETNYSIKHIAILTGYEDLPNFSRDFKRQKGMPPNEWRRKNVLLSQAEAYVSVYP